jgi:hypothetical protein
VVDLKDMGADLKRIHGLIDRLVRRERTLILALVLSRAALLLLLVAVVCAVAALFRWDRSTAAASLVFISGAGAWAVVMSPLLRRWRQAADRRRQAGLVEGLLPTLRGRLMTAVERPSGALGNESPALLGLVAKRAADATKSVRPGRVHSGQRALLVGTVAMMAWFVTLPMSFMLPGGPDGVWRWWAAGMSAHAAADGRYLGGGEDLARVGDLVLRYKYPEYTGLPPREVPNSTGEAMGPPGTTVVVIARTGEPVEAAAIAAYDEPALEAELDDEQRQLTGRFTIQAFEGAYHLVLYRDAMPTPSPEFAITPDPDLAPEVLLTHDGGALELAVDQTFTLDWRAKDDYGVRSVEARIDGQDTGRILARPDRRRTEVHDQLMTSPSDLGLVPGQRVSLTIGAWDNDTYSGTKLGESRPIELVVLGPRGMDERAAERQEKLRDLMLDALADFLEEEWPAGETSGALAAWGKEVSGRYQGLEDLAEELWGGYEVSSLEGTVTNDALDAARELIRYTQVSFIPGNTTRPKAAAFAVTAELRTEAIITLEDGILALDRSLRLRAMREVSEQADRLAEMADRLKELLAEENPDVQELLARLDQLERMFSQLTEAAEKLEDGGLKELLNTREHELKGLMDEIREQLAAGDTEDAEQLMSRLADQLNQLAQGVQDTLDRMKSEGDDRMKKAQSLVEELERVEKEQRELQREVQTAREELDEESAEQASDLWKDIQAGADEVHRLSEEYVEGLEGSDRSFFEQQRAKAALEETKVLRGATEARDLWGAQDAVDVARANWTSAERGLSIERRRTQDLLGPSEAELGSIQGELTKLQRLLDRLDQLAQAPSASGSQSQQQRQRQAELKKELEQLSEQAGELVRDFPVQPRNLEENLEGADQRMERAIDDLGRGNPMSAEGSQGVAAQRVKEARESLQQAMQQAKQQSQQLSKRGEGKPKDGDGEGQSQRQEQRMMLPQAEEFQTPEEYRRALLEGMEAEVPEQYRALKKRYYEELVSQ